MTFWIPDVSEFQDVDWGVFSGPVIVRAHNSARPDRKWLENGPRAAQQPWWGAYQYLTKSADPDAAARTFIATLGDLRPSVVILDLEEGDGDQSGRQAAWLGAITGLPEWTYSGAYFARAHNITVDWIAAYQRNEPTDSHLLWQAADNHFFPGIGNCDGSVFNGTVDDLIALTGRPLSTEDTMTDDDRAWFDLHFQEIKQHVDSVEQKVDAPIDEIRRNLRRVGTATHAVGIEGVNPA